MAPQQQTTARPAGCGWAGHAEAVSEAGWCPECDSGTLDAAWADRHGIDE